jgi:hypothetical protein
MISMLRALSVAWVLAVVAGMCVLQRFEARPGDDGAPAGHWPSGTRLTLAPDRPTLLLFVDANCPCSRASLTEFGRIAARVAMPTALMVVVSGGTGRAAEDAAAIPGVRVLVDTQSLEAARFAVATSGHALLFETSGRLLFSGGITAARGHEGDSLGGDAILARIAAKGGPRCDAPVFGCTITSGGGDDIERERPR